MNDHELSTALRAFHVERAQVPDQPGLHEHVFALPLDDIPQQRSWLPRLDTGRFQSMFSATKFVVAGAIVALFGGFLLSGVLTQPSEEQVPVVGASASASAEPTEATTTEPEPTMAVEAEMTTRSDLLPGVDLVTEEVEQGVFRVLSDGVRELTDVPVGAAGEGEDAFWRFVLTRNVAAGDDSLWWFGPEGYFRVGDDRAYGWASDAPVRGTTDIEVDREGIVWATDTFPEGLRAFDGSSWSDSADRRFVAVEIDEEGTFWAVWETKNEKRRVVGRLIDGAWQRLEGQLPRHEVCRKDDSCTVYGFGGLSLSDDGSPWVVTGGPPALFRHDGEGWRGVDTPRGVPVWGAIAPDGTRWVNLRRKNDIVLARHDGDGWTVFESPGTRWRHRGWPPYLQIAPDSSLWVNPVEGPNGPGDCRGVTRFDEGEPQHYLGQLCIHAMDIGSDGNVWLQAGEVRDGGQSLDLDRVLDLVGPIHTYVITPEAMVATE